MALAVLRLMTSSNASRLFHGQNGRIGTFGVLVHIDGDAPVDVA